tara:strand:+ start:2618 stop:3103 length:486 start_codon:yes stop_codon:yes gene_type:complete
MSNIIIKDNLFNQEEKENIYNFCKTANYKRLESDGLGLPYTGLVFQFDLNHPIVKLILKKLNLKDLQLDRAYINLFLQGEKPFFHQDNTQLGYKTLLYYVNTEPKNIDELGETYFFINNEVKGIQPLPGRVIIFDAEIFHRASSLRNYDRFTIAFKWKGQQ